MGSVNSACAEAAAAIRTRARPLNLEPTKPGKSASKVGVIIWKDDYIEFKKKERMWAQTNPWIFNMVLGQCTQEMKAKLEGREGWPTILEEQDGVALLKAIHRLCNQQDSWSTGLMEIVTLEKSLALNVQGKRSTFDYLRAFRANADTINLAGGYAGESIATTKLVAKEQDFNYELADPMKQSIISKEAAKRYLAALAFTGLNSKRHNQLKANVK